MPREAARPGDDGCGIERAARIVELKTPIVFLTAVVKKEEVQAHAGVIGGFPYIAKPLDVKGVIAVIEENLGK